MNDEKEQNIAEIDDLEQESITDGGILDSDIADIDAISQFIGTETGVEYDIVPYSDDIPQLSTNDEPDIDSNTKEDYNQARFSMKDAIDTATNAIQKLAAVAEDSESPRAYEVLVGALKTVTEMNKSLMELHKDTKEIISSKKSAHQNADVINNNQYVFQGSVEELQQKLLESKENNE